MNKINAIAELNTNGRYASIKNNGNIIYGAGIPLNLPTA